MMLGLNQIMILNGGQSRSITGENKEGKKGAGGQAAGDLGKGRKGSPCTSLPMGKTTVLADIEGPGTIQHIFFTVTNKTEKGCFVLRDLVLRVYWDEEEKPSVECPVGDFFCCGFGVDCTVNSLPIVVNPVRGFHCYFPMPFKKHAKITIENQHPADIGGFFYQIDYNLKEVPENAGYFYAQWRREPLTIKAEDYTILDNVSGQGQYIGTYVGIAALERYWWGEGEMKFYLDGDVEYPTICGTGTEDYFGGAWSYAGFKDGKFQEQSFCTPFIGYPFYSKNDSLYQSCYFNDDCPPMRGLYRWHIMDPICFEKDIRVTMQQIGLSPYGLFERQDDVCSVAYWYLDSPCGFEARLTEREARLPR